MKVGKEFVVEVGLVEVFRALPRLNKRLRWGSRTNTYEYMSPVNPVP